MEADRARSRPWVSGILFGCGLGAAFAVSPGGVFVVALVVLAGGVLYRVAGAADRRFVVGLLVVGFVLRAVLSLGLDAGAWFVEGQPAGKYAEPQGWDLGVVDRTREYVKMGDSDYLSQRGYAAVQLARGIREPVVVFRAQQRYGRNGYAYVVGAFYWLFGFSPTAVKLLNCLIGALLGPVMFILTRLLFHAPIARWAGAAVTGLPSLILWSATNLKEPSLHLLTAIMLLLLAKCQVAQGLGARARYAVLLACAMGAHMTLRAPVYSLILVACGLLPWVVAACLRTRWRVLLTGGLLAGGLALGYTAARPVLAQAFYVHSGHWSTPGTSYQYLPARFYESGYVWEWRESSGFDAEVMAGMGKAVWHYLLEPFPSRIDSAFAVAAYPQMVAWYFVLPLAFVGMMSALRWNLQQSLGLGLMLLGWILVGALTSGNVGTLFRMRDMVAPFVLMFACAQIWMAVYGSPRCGGPLPRDRSMPIAGRTP